MIKKYFKNASMYLIFSIVLLIFLATLVFAQGLIKPSIVGNTVINGSNGTRTTTLVNSINSRLTNDVTDPISVLVFPKIGYTTIASQNISFGCFVSDDRGIKNVTLYGSWDGWHADETDSSGLNGVNYTFTKNVTSGFHRWSCYVCDTSNNCKFSNVNRTVKVEETPAFVVWFLSDAHVQTDLWNNPPYRSLEGALNDSLYGGDEGGEPFPYWDIIVSPGDWTGGQQCPGDEDGHEVVEQILSSGVNPNRIYGAIGNHDANLNYTFFNKWIDPLGENTATSKINNSMRPYPVIGEWDHYSFVVGNMVFLVLGDRNAPGEPFGRECYGGYPSGAVTLETYEWWRKMVILNQDKIIITVSHEGVVNTTACTGIKEAYLNGIHGIYSWADKNGSSMIYAIGNWTVDGLDLDGNYIGERPYGFNKFIEENPGAIDFWVHGHTHKDFYPGKVCAGKPDINTKNNVTFMNAGAVTKKHGAPLAPYSLLLYVYPNGTAIAKHYIHAEVSDLGRVYKEGFYNTKDVVIQMDKNFTFS